MSVMTMISGLFAESVESRSESQVNRKAESQASKAKSHESQKSQKAFAKTLKIFLPPISCTGCKHAENIPGVGEGCVYRTSGDYPNIWTLLDSLDECPRGYIN
jgi:hypothetical protein